MKRNPVGGLLQGIFILVGAGMLIAGYFAAPGSLTDDGYPLNYFFYAMGAFFIVWPILLFGAMRFFFRKAEKKADYLREQGIKGKGRVLQMRRTGVSINDVPQVILDLQITTEFGEQIQTSYKKCIDPIYYSLIRPDTDLTVYVHPVNKQEVLVDLEGDWARIAGSGNGAAGL